MISLEFDAGSILVSGSELERSPIQEWLTFDPRVHAYRACANEYPRMISTLRIQGRGFKDLVPAFSKQHWKITTKLSLRTYQEEALHSWEQSNCCGVIVLPTGVGKSIVAVKAIERVATCTLVVLPTIDLMSQWAALLENQFDTKIGMLGGGSKEVRTLTVSTYDSASMMMEFIGNQFGFVIFDECHHLPGAVYRCAAEMACAPNRLGLTATPEREDGLEEVSYKLLGPVVYRREIDEFEQGTLSPYKTRRIEVALDPDERVDYQQNRKAYKDFLTRYNIRISSRYGWNHFLRACATKSDGRDAMRAYQSQKRIAAAGRKKVEKIWELILQHPGERMIIFTAHNDLAYQIGELYLLPVLTHLTKAEERKVFLNKLRSGVYKILVTSKVLNEGIDVPEVSVGIVVSGSGSVREHVQRLGRLLRPREQKKAILYELISSDTGEYYISQNRRQHRAYQRPASISCS